MHSFISILLALPILASAHGFLSSPPPRGIQKEGYQVDDLKSPNSKGLCRGEPVGKITKVKPGQSLTLGLTITAPHVGPCRVTILDANLKNERPVAEKFNCAAPGAPKEWTIRLPSGLNGHKVLRWYWEGQHVSPGEPYEQCIDLNFGGASDDTYNGSDGDADDQEEDHPVRPFNHQPKSPKNGNNGAPSYDAPAQDDTYGRPKGQRGNRGGRNDYNQNQGNDYNQNQGNDYNQNQGNDYGSDQGNDYNKPKPKGGNRGNNRSGRDSYGSNQGNDYKPKPKGGNRGNNRSGRDNYNGSENDANYGSNNGDNSYSGSSPSGKCTAGSYKCASDGGFHQCANGAWVKMQCAAGTKCRANGNQITCDWANRPGQK